MRLDYINKLNLIRASLIQRNIRQDAEERWVTTEKDHRIHINSEGEIDKGNPHVLAAIEKSRQRTASLDKVPVGARVKAGGSYWVKTKSGEYRNMETGEVRKGQKLGSFESCAKTKVYTRQGNEINLTECPLHYTEKAKFLNESIKKSVCGFEEKRRKSKIEYGMLVDENGTVLCEKKGKDHSVTMPVSYYRMAKNMTHIHPRKDGVNEIGGTFSVSDLKAFTIDKVNLQSMRAAAPEGIYTIEPQKGFNIKGLLKEYSHACNNSKEYKEYTAFAEKYKKENEEKKEKLFLGKIGWSEYISWHDKNIAEGQQHFNRVLVANHNTLLNLQEKYHYNYYLEEWS